MIKYETNSKLVKKGQIFVAIKGFTVDGHDYIDDAIKNGAIKVVGEKDLKLEVPYEKVENSEEYLKEALVKEYSQEFKNLKLIGVTGTTGKTTNCYLIYQMLKEIGKNSAYLGTIGYYHSDKHEKLANTTPDILSLYKILIDSVHEGIEYVVMEVSSHSLSYERVAGLHFIAGAFTNLTEDHLDYHKTMEAYLKEKVKLTKYINKDGIMLLNSDDEASESFKVFPNYKTYGLKGDYKIIKYDYAPDHTDLTFSYENKTYNVTTNLTSIFNVYNYLTCISILNSIGFSLEDLIKVTKNVYAPKGRCETYKVGKAFAVIDYAHTPDAFEKVIAAYREFSQNRIITIFGCGGDRDPYKRPIMGDIATSLSDYVILTTDNPRTENVNDIMNDIIKNNNRKNYEIIYDRTEAINKGLNMLKENDILLVLGKGHEDYQIIGHEKLYFSDAEIIKNFTKK